MTSRISGEEEGKLIKTSPAKAIPFDSLLLVHSRLASRLVGTSSKPRKLGSRVGGHRILSRRCEGASR
jgi:hypothetical protein